MSLKVTWRRSGVVALLLVLSGVATLAAQQTVTVFAAASLTEAFTALGRAFEEQHRGVRVQFNFAGSQLLATQLEQGARADVFASADQRWMRYAGDKRLLSGAPVTFARNRLVLITPVTNPGGITKLEDLVRPGLTLVLAGRQVPAGAYAREALARLARAPGFPARFDQRVLANLASEEENVRAVVAKVQLREADAGIVYQTDVSDAARRQLRLLEIPEAYNPVAEYPIATVAGGSALGAEFVTLVLSAEGQSVLRARGFLPPAGAAP